MGMVEMDDVNQHFRPDVDIFFYFKASPRDMQRIKENDKEEESYEDDGSEFHSLRKTPDGAWPFWEPHFDFLSEVEPAFVTDYSYWIKGDKIYGRKNILPKIQQRINHTAFPYDRQIIDVVLLSNNCIFKRWDIGNRCPSEQRLSYDEWHVQGLLNSLADIWDLERIRIRIEADEKECNSKATIFLYVEREYQYYMTNISVMLSLIVMLQTWMPNFPYDESRFDFALQLVLTQIAFRFVTQNLIPLNNYQMYLDWYMLVGFLVLFFRCIIDFLLPFFYTVPEVGPGDDFRCEFHYNDFFNGENCFFGGDYSSEACGGLAEICVRDVQITLGLFLFWVVVSVAFLIPRLWRRTWTQVEQSLDRQKASSTTFWTKGSSKPAVVSSVSVADWLHEHREGLKNQPSFSDTYRSALELKGWAEPEDEYSAREHNEDFSADNAKRWIPESGVDRRKLMTRDLYQEQSSSSGIGEQSV